MSKQRGWEDTLAEARFINDSRAKVQLQQAIQGIGQAKGLPKQTLDAIDEIFYKMPVSCFRINETCCLVSGLSSHKSCFPLCHQRLPDRRADSQ